MQLIETLDKRKRRRRIAVAIILSLTTLILFSGGYFWQQISGLAQPIAIFAILGLSLVVLIKLIVSIIKIFKLKSFRNLKIWLPSIIYLSTIILVFTTPKWLFVDYYLSKIIYRGCYEGTMNDTTIVFRKSGEFEYRDVGFFAMTVFKKGRWTKTGDTIKISSEHQIPVFLGNKLLITETEFINISDGATEKNKSNFYRGYCKGLN